ncbi:MAG: MFS transporter [Gemmatimonadota bacterium]|nr:MFS transporter [Gemmatimonadota bacterium]MDH4350438.1 MFS transporter [Gemmatimonadota bacterium]MDH5197216.1 MFS transporter [Gemmatimonadota bacterium]
MADTPPVSGGTRLPPVVRGLGAVSFFNDLASEMVYPLLPQLITRGLGAGALALGALDGVADAVSAVVKLAAGWLSDRPAWRQPLIVFGYLTAAVTRPLMAITGAAWQVVGLRAADRVGKGARNPPRDAVIADAVDPSLRGRAFGFHRAMDHAGATVGPLVAGGLMAAFAVRAETVILWSIVPGVLAVVVAMVALRRFARPDGATDQSTRPPQVEGHAPRPVVVALIFLFAGLRMPEALFLLRLQDLGIAAPLVPVMWAALHVVRTGASYPGGWLSDRLGPARTMLLGWVAYAGVSGGMAVVTGPWGGLWLLGLGLVSACTESPERALVAAWGGKKARGRRFGVYHAGTGVVALPGGLALGAIYQWAGGPMALGVSAVAVLGLAVAAAAVIGLRPGSGS